MARFFASSKPNNQHNSSSEAAVSSEHPHRRNSSNGESRKPDITTPSSSSRWGRRPRLRRQCAHEFDQIPLQKPPQVSEQLSRESCESGYTEAPSSRGASETLAAPSPSVAGFDDILGDVSDDDLSWLEDDLPPALAGEDEIEEVAPNDGDFLPSGRNTKARRAELEPPLVLRVEDFECGECVGKGSYSRVFLGTHMPSGSEWALKVVSKRRTFETRENLAHLREEKNIASKAQGSDFLVRTAGTFQNPKSVVFAMEYLPGGDLYQRLADKGTLPLGEAVAWVAQAVLAIEDLHALNIVHRDVKPENFLMGKSGTLKLSDFGFARELAPGERLFSQFGTPEYVAPEVLNGCGHGKPVDLWALGVLIYELLVGRTPFKASNVDDMYERIAAGDYAFPAPPARRSPSVRSKSSAAAAAATAGSSQPHGAAGRCPNKKILSSANKKGHHPHSLSYGGIPLPSSTTSQAGGRSFDSNNSTSSFYLPSSTSLPSRSGAGQGPATTTATASPSVRAAKAHEAGGDIWRTASQSSMQVRAEPRTRGDVTRQRQRQVRELRELRAMEQQAAREREQEVLEAEDGAQDAAAQSLVKSLLQLNPYRRPSIDEIKRHPFFDGVNFDALRAAVRAQADAEEEEMVVSAAMEGGEVWLRNQRVTCLSEDVDDNYGGVFAGF